jgi:uncharacterized protein YcgI (DUF1989 family)
MTGKTDSLTLVEEFVIAAGKGRSFTVRQGQVCRVTALEGEQCLDAVFLNAQDHRERFHTFFSYSFNCKLGTGDAFHCRTLFSGPPWERPMMTVLEDTVKRHFVPCSGRCSPMIYRLRDKVEGHPSCQQNLAEALAPHGIGEHEVPDVFNMFMNAGIDEKGLIYIRPPTARKGDYMDLRAEMDILCAISACPDDKSVCNNHKPKPVGIRIYDVPLVA